MARGTRDDTAPAVAERITANGRLLVVLTRPPDFPGILGPADVALLVDQTCRSAGVLAEATDHLAAYLARRPGRRTLTARHWFGDPNGAVADAVTALTGAARALRRADDHFDDARTALRLTDDDRRGFAGGLA